MNKDDEGDDWPSADDSAGDQEKVGYKQPPKQTRYRAGRSGKPSGRPKGARGLATIMREVASETHTIVENGKPQERTNLELVLLALSRLMATGKPKATRVYEKHQELFGPQDSLQPTGYLLIPEPPPRKEFERLCKEYHDNLYEFVAQQMTRHNEWFEKWKAQHGK